MKSKEDLRNLLDRIDRKSYPAYKDTRGSYDFGMFILNIDHVQGDPFAAPSKVSVTVNGTRAGFPEDYYRVVQSQNKDGLSGQTYDEEKNGVLLSKQKRVALQDFILRAFAQEIGKFQRKAKGSGKSGAMQISHCGQEILERTACQVSAKDGTVRMQMEVGFPARGRTIDSKELQKIFYDYLPKCVEQALLYKNVNQPKLKSWIGVTVDVYTIRQELKKKKLTAFVANGSILPRETGVSSRPMKEAVLFESPKSMEIELDLPNRGTICGMGIPQGITLIVGGGYHGKSTLLEALELGVYTHIPGDGREYIVTDDTAVKIRAEDGRCIHKDDISLFISHLPNGKNTVEFVSEDASGSTSQAANVVEAMEAGAKTLLMDEDTSATNFMIRDGLMQQVVCQEAEPITPFLDRIEDLSKKCGISTVLVAGSSGAYFYKADKIIQMESYKPKDITEFAKEKAAAYASDILCATSEQEFVMPKFTGKPRYMDASRGSVRGSSRGSDRDSRVKMKTMGLDGVMIQHEVTDLRYVEQLVDSEQVSALGYLLMWMIKKHPTGTLQEVVEEIQSKMETEGLSVLADENRQTANLAWPRKQEMMACLNRCRQIKFD
ncbi:MAG: ABC-ATPase domain-containing protein [Lachnospiraceae bacterium]|nr:ABC-ATPase domain-containing protein [Lachnospiraceae bacterium]MDD3615608.1 ABC-ATPase domain-containing protein [Lachnospiraceae bacterium]